MTTIPTEIPGVNLRFFDFSEETRDRIWEIYRRRKVDKMTLRAMAPIYGVSKERIRQLVAKAHRAETKRKQLKRRMERGDVPLRMENMPLSATCYYALKRLEAMRMTPEEFVTTFTILDVIKVKGMGRTHFMTLFKALEEIAPDAANLWTARDRENNNAA